MHLGSRDGAVVRALASQQRVAGSIPGPGVVCGLSLLLLLYSAPRGFSPGTPVFPFPLKSYIIMKSTCPNSNSILECTNITERATKLLGATLLYFYFCLLMKVLHVSYLVYIFRLISSKRN